MSEPYDCCPKTKRVAHESVPWSLKEMALAMAFGAAVMLGAATLVASIGQLAPGRNLPASVMGSLVMAAELALLLPVWWLGPCKYRLSWSSLGFRPPDSWRAVGLGCLTLMISMCFNAFWAALLALWGLEMQPQVLPLFGGGLVGLFAALLAGGVFAPIAEEVFFRGYLHAGLRARLGHGCGLVLSSSLFAVAHVLPTSWPPIFLLGLLFALLFEATGSIWPAIAAHSAINVLGLLASYALASSAG